MAHRTNHLIDAYRRLKQKPEPIVLATIVETFGSTYQKAGARMLIDKNGETTGLLGGGCFESDLLEQAQPVFESGQSKTVFYDMRSPDDVVWGLGLGCNGALRIMLQLLNPGDDFFPLNVFAENSESRQFGVLVSFFESSHPDYPAGYTLFLPTSTLESNEPETVASAPIVVTAKQTDKRRHAGLESQTLDGHSVKVFYDPIRPPLQLLIVGAGADAIPLVQCAKTLGWRITVVDYRPAHIKPERFALSDALLLLTPQELSEKLTLDQFDALVLMTHNIEYDERYLKTVASSRIPFIGLLGPAQRRNKLLQSLGDEAALLTGRAYGPVGLDIGAEAPEEIALSVMAGIYASLNDRAGGQLDSKTVTDFFDVR